MFDLFDCTSVWHITQATAKASMPVHKQRCSVTDTAAKRSHASEVQQWEMSYITVRTSTMQLARRSPGGNDTPTARALRRRHDVLTAGKGVAPPRGSIPRSSREKARSAGAAARAHGAAAAVMAAPRSLSVWRCRAR